jgi:hypothetical protein
MIGKIWSTFKEQSLNLKITGKYILQIVPSKQVTKHWFKNEWPLIIKNKIPKTGTGLNAST